MYTDKKGFAIFLDAQTFKRDSLNINGNSFGCFWIHIRIARHYKRCSANVVKMFNLVLVLDILRS
jgi:hypothetical protein